MATRSQIQKITTKAIFDNDFRKRLMASPKKAADELGIKLAKNEVDYIRSLDPGQLELLASEVRSLTHSDDGATLWA